MNHPPPTPLRTHWRPILLLTLYLLLAASYAIINPIHEGTDEIRHYRFVQYIVQNKTLPIQGQEECRSQSHHPPLIYVLGALVSGWVDTGEGVCDNPAENPFWGYRAWEVSTDNKNMFLHPPAESFPWRGEALAAHLVRFLNVLIGAAAVWLTYAAARTIWPRKPWMPLGAAGFIAFSPMFLYMSGTINNDVIAALSGAAVLYAALRLLYHDESAPLNWWRWGLTFGLTYALALMSKFNLAPIILIIEVVMLWIAYQRSAWGWWLKTNLTLTAVTLLGAGWWFLRNYLIFGDPTGFQELTNLWGVRNPRDSFWLAVQELPQVWSSLWGRFGFGQIPIPYWIYDFLWWMTVFATVGIAYGLLRPYLQKSEKTPSLRAVSGVPTEPLLAQSGDRPEQLHKSKSEKRDARLRQRLAIGLLLLQVAIFFAVVFAYMLVSPAGAMGRFFFPGLPALVILIFYGLSQWVTLGRRWYAETTALRGLALLVNLGMLTLAAVALFGYLAPAYANPPTWTDADLATAEHQTDIRFDSLVALRGYTIHPETVMPDGRLQIDLYWEVLNQPPGDYWLFVHLIDEANTMVTQRDTHPGLGKFPASHWRPGDRFIDTVWLPLPATAYPATADLHIGLYAPNAYRLGVSAADGTPLGDSYILDQLTIIDTPSGRLPNHHDLNFESHVRLLDYTYNTPRLLQPGDTVEIALEYEMLHTDLDGQLSRVIVTSADGTVYLESDVPMQGLRPSAKTPHRVTALHTVDITPAMPQDSYTVSVVFIDIFTQNRATIIAEDGHWIDNQLQLAPFRVIPAD